MQLCGEAALGDQAVQQLLLAGKVVEDECLGDTGALRNRLRGGCGEAAGGELAERGVEDALAIGADGLTGSADLGQW